MIKNLTKYFRLIPVLLICLTVLLIQHCKPNVNDGETSIKRDNPTLLEEEIPHPKMQIGVSYYPERRNPDKWPQDFEMMAEVGIKRIRIAEFAWSRLEPDDGVYTWNWLDESISMAEFYGIEVMLCTPTATPPIWLVENHPDIMPVDDMGRRNVFGGRQHRCYNTPEYVRYSLRIVKRMAEKYGNHPNVVAWQLDNEFGGEQKYCYCKNCDLAFQQFLEKEYSTIDSLNKRWGNEFWSMDYQRFDQIKTPQQYKGTLWLKAHPSIGLEFCRFSSESMVKFANQQVEILRQYTGERPITTNRFAYNWGDNLDSYALTYNLDAAGTDIYSNKPYEIAFYADINWSLKPGHSWFLEYGTRSKNFDAELNMLQERGVAWLYFFKWNPFPAGQEQSMASLLTITGEYTDNLAKLKSWIANNRNTQPEVLKYKSSEVGLYYDFESSWALYLGLWGEYQERLKYQDYVINCIYKPLFDLNDPVKFIFQPKDVENIHTLIIPLKIIYDTILENKIIEFVEQGGTLIVTNDLFRKNRDNVYLDKLPRIYTNLFGVNDNNFVFAGREDDLIVMQAKFGKGKAFMVNEFSDAEGWDHIVKELIIGSADVSY